MEIMIASPRGFCAGVERAISIVEKALEKYGTPIYVKHEIVHNKYVVETLKKKGVIFIEEIEEVPKEALIIFSAHGVANEVYQKSKDKKLTIIDATCPLVKKVHYSVKKHNNKRHQVILIGHSGHPEVAGTMGQLEAGEVTLVQSVEDVGKLSFTNEVPLAYTTQTTLSINETKDIISALKEKYPDIKGPDKGDLCYATTNRQKAISQIAPKVDLFLVIGSKNSSNSNRLRELASQYNIPSYLIDNVSNIDLGWFKGIEKIGISSGASAPEILTKEVISFLKQQLNITAITEINSIDEKVFFPLPVELR